MDINATVIPLPTSDLKNSLIAAYLLNMYGDTPLASLVILVEECPRLNLWPTPLTLSVPLIISHKYFKCFTKPFIYY